MTIQERLRPALELKPEVASLNMGSMNFGLYPMLERFREFRFDWEREYLRTSDDRVFKNTFAQTGDPIAPNVSGPGYVFPDDGLPASSSEYVRGAMLFAHEAADLNGSQFLFITGSNGTTLRPTFPLFGQVTKGIAVLDKINDGATDDSNTQAIRYSIISITIEEQED